MFVVCVEFVVNILGLLMVISIICWWIIILIKVIFVVKFVDDFVKVLVFWGNIWEFMIK